MSAAAGVTSDEIAINWNRELVTAYSDACVWFGRLTEVSTKFHDLSKLRQLDGRFDHYKQVDRVEAEYYPALIEAMGRVNQAFVRAIGDFRESFEMSVNQLHHFAQVWVSRIGVVTQMIRSAKLVDEFDEVVNALQNSSSAEEAAERLEAVKAQYERILTLTVGVEGAKEQDVLNQFINECAHVVVRADDVIDALKRSGLLTPDVEGLPIEEDGEESFMDAPALRDAAGTPNTAALLAGVIEALEALPVRGSEESANVEMSVRH